MDDIYLRITENVTAIKIKARIARCGNCAPGAEAPFSFAGFFDIISRMNLVGEGFRNNLKPRESLLQDHHFGRGEP